MRTLLIVMGLVIVAAPAHARSSRVVVVMSDQEPMSAALRLALANRGVVITNPHAPEGGLRLDRAAAVQRVVVSSHADAGVWIEEALGEVEVCAVSADGMYLQHAPLPDRTSPRVFAAIATSLLDELVGPREAGAPPSINVNVGVTLPPATAIMPTTTTLSRAHRTLVEVGAIASPATIGLELELAFPLDASWRFGVVGSGSKLFDGIGDMAKGTAFYTGGVELRHVGAGEDHFDLAVRGGLGHGWAYGEGDTGELGSVQASYVWDSRSSGVELSVAPMLLTGFRGHDTTFGLMTSLRWELPL